MQGGGAYLSTLSAALRGGEHRLEGSEVGADGLDLGGQDDLEFVSDGLRVVALQEPARALDDA